MSPCSRYFSQNEFLKREIENPYCFYHVDVVRICTLDFSLSGHALKTNTYSLRVNGILRSHVIYLCCPNDCKPGLSVSHRCFLIKSAFAYKKNCQQIITSFSFLLPDNYLYNAYYYAFFASFNTPQCCMRQETCLITDNVKLQIIYLIQW